MVGMRAVVLVGALLGAGCYHPSPRAGSPCDERGACPEGLECSSVSLTCETPGGAVIDAPVVTDARRLIDGCTPTDEICGDAIDQDCDGIDPPCPANDLAAGAIDIGAGGTFTVDATFATDDASRPTNGAPACGNAGGRDVFYKIHLDVDEAIYLDTFGSTYDTLIRVFHGACRDGAAPGFSQCQNDACMTAQTQHVWDLTAGDTCIVVDQFAPAGTAGMLTLHVERGGRTGTGISLGTPVTGTTVGATNQSQPPCNPNVAPDLGYHFTECPGGSVTFVATTCNGVTDYDVLLYVRGPTGNLRCNDDDAMCNTAPTYGGNATTAAVTVAGPHMFWIIVDGGSPDSTGPFELDTILQ